MHFDLIQRTNLLCFRFWLGFFYFEIIILKEKTVLKIYIMSVTQIRVFRQTNEGLGFCIIILVKY